jgi:uncharacterized protein (TIGR00369 family)
MEQPTGLDLVRAIFDGRLPAPGAARLLEMSGVMADEGRVVFALEPGPLHANPMGTTHGGILATMLDSAMTCAVHTMLPSGKIPTTLDLSVRYLKSASTTTGRLEAEGLAVHIGGRVATAEGRITGPDGTLYATGTTSCMILDLA